MERFIELSRSNYFRVKSFKAFKAICDANGLTLLQSKSPSRRTEVGFVISDGKNAPGESFETFKKELSSVLQQGEVCVVRTVSFVEGTMDELNGWTVAIDSRGRELQVDLDHIYQMVETRWEQGDVAPTEEE